MDAIYIANEVLRRTGLSYQRLDSLCRAGVVEPSVKGATGKGSRRVYNEDDVKALLIGERLRVAGLSAAAIRHVLSGLRRTRNLTGSTCVVTDGRGVTCLEEQDLGQYLQNSKGAWVSVFRVGDVCGMAVTG